MRLPFHLEGHSVPPFNQACGQEQDWLIIPFVLGGHFLLAYFSYAYTKVI